MKTNLQANQTSRTQRGSVNVIRTIAAFVLVAVMTVGGINLRLITVEAAGVPAGYEPTITTSIGGTQNRELFTSRGANSYIYYNGRLYSRADFFDAHNGSSFRMNLMPRRESRERFGEMDVWRTTRRTDQDSPPARIAGSEAPQTTLQPAPTPNSTQPPSQAAPDVVVNSTGNGSGGQGLDMVSDNNQVNNNSNQTIVTSNNDATLTTRVYMEAELLVMIEHAPDVRATSEARLHRNNRARELSDIEVNVWLENYLATGGANWQEFAVIMHINTERANAGLHPLRLCPNLMMAARMSQEYYQTWEDRGERYRGHASGLYSASTSAFGTYWSGGLRGPSDVVVDEPQRAVYGWLASPAGHREALLSPDVSYVGVGIVFGFENGGERRGTLALLR